MSKFNRQPAAPATGVASVERCYPAERDGTARPADALDDLRDKLVVNGQPLPVESLASSPIEGLFEVKLTSGETFFTDATGKHLDRGGNVPQRR